MSKVKYYYDPDTLSYRKIEVRRSEKYKKTFFGILFGVSLSADPIAFRVCVRDSSGYPAVGAIPCGRSKRGVKADSGDKPSFGTLNVPSHSSV